MIGNYDVPSFCSWPNRKPQGGKTRKISVHDGSARFAERVEGFYHTEANKDFFISPQPPGNMIPRKPIPQSSLGNPPLSLQPPSFPTIGPPPHSPPDAVDVLEFSTERWNSPNSDLKTSADSQPDRAPPRRCVLAFQSAGYAL